MFRPVCSRKAPFGEEAQRENRPWRNSRLAAGRPAAVRGLGPQMSGPPNFRLEHSELRADDEFGEFASEDLPYYAGWRGSFEKLPWALDEEALRGADVAVVGAPFD